MPRLGDIEFEIPVMAAPMAGGPTTPELVAAAARVGGIGFLAAGYRLAQDLPEQIASVRDCTSAFGMNLFAPPAIPVDPAAFRVYRDLLQSEAERYGVALPESPREDDDDWAAKIDLLVHNPIPAISFTFGVPGQQIVRALRKAGTFTLQTVTTVAEAQWAETAGVDALVVQSGHAGGHSASLTPQYLSDPIALPDLVRHIASTTRLPIIGAGGVASSADTADILAAGATAVAVGTLLLRSDEAGTSAPYRAALAAGNRDTTMTRAFSGRPARGLRNDFMDRYNEVAPSGYPAVHHLTSPLRKAATLAGDPEMINLWAGTGYRSAVDQPAGAIMSALARGL